MTNSLAYNDFFMIQSGSKNIIVAPVEMLQKKPR